MTCGPTRDLTAKFLKLRVEHRQKKHRFAYAHDVSPIGGRQNNAARSERLLPRTANSRAVDSGTPAVSGSEVRIEMTTLNALSLPPLWVDVVEETQDSISRIKEKMSLLQKAQQRRLLRVFGPHAMNKKPDSEIEALSEEITKFFRQAEGAVRTIVTVALSGNDDEKSLQMRKNAQTSLATQLRDLSVEFRKQQKIFAGELKKRGNDEGSGGLTSEGGGAARLQQQKQVQGFSDSQMTQMQIMEEEVQARNEEIAHITQSVAEMHSIFKELAALVIDQGTILDRIDYNVEQVVEETRKATAHIEKAEAYRNSGRARRVILFLIVADVILMLLFIWKHM